MLVNIVMVNPRQVQKVLHFLKLKRHFKCYTLLKITYQNYWVLDLFEFYGTSTQKVIKC